MPATPLLRRRGVAGRRRGHEVRNARTRLSPREETTYKAHSSHWAAGGGGVIDAGESAVGIGVVFAGRSGDLPENAPVTPLSLDACLRRLRNGVIDLRVLSTSTVAGVSTSCCWALASGVSVGRGDSAIAGCPLRSQPPPPMHARHCANICSGGRPPNVFGHAAGFFTARWRTRTLPSLLAEEPPACTRNAGTTCAVKSRAWGLAGAKCSPARPSHKERAIFAAKPGAPGV